MKKIIVLFLVCFAGCLPHPLLRRASHDFSCPEENVQIQYIGAGAITATGCGQSASYVCEQSSGGQGGIFPTDSNTTCRRENR
jgi:hypothetical protein